MLNHTIRHPSQNKMNIVTRILKNKGKREISSTSIDKTPCHTTVDTLHDLELVSITVIEEPYRPRIRAVSNNLLLPSCPNTFIIPIGRHGVFL